MCFIRTQSYLVIMLITIRKFTVQSYNNKINSSWKRAALNFVQKRTFSDTSYLDMNHDSKIQFGNYDLIASAGKSTRKFTDVQTIGNENGPADGQYVWVRGRLNSLRTKGNAVFAILRTDGQHTIQACHFKDKDNVTLSKELIKFIDKIPLESIIDIFGQVVSAEVRSCSKNTKEIAIKKCFVVSKALTVLPFLFEDASRSAEDITASKDSTKKLAGVEQVSLHDELLAICCNIVVQDVRLNNRWLDLRVLSNNAIMRIRSGMSQYFRESLINEGFVEIHTPKLVSGESEGGSEVFRTDYFGQPACLAQSPQLYKQMAISSDLMRVFEVGPVFRAENSNTRRHLCEFTGLDIEMTINDHYDEVLEVLHIMFKYMFDNLEKRYSKELSTVREQYPSEPIVITDHPCILHWPEAMQMLQEYYASNGTSSTCELDVMADLTAAHELRLGSLVKKKYGTDLFILDQYPSTVRPFYTMPNPKNPDFSNSYDIFLRGQEICSGAQRCHDVDLLVKRIKEKNIILSASLAMYVESFRHGIYPHGGAGIGLDRLLFLYLGLDSIKKASMFPRDPGRCVP